MTIRSKMSVGGRCGMAPWTPACVPVAVGGYKANQAGVIMADHVGATTGVTPNEVW